MTQNRIYEYDTPLHELPESGGAYVIFPWNVRQEFGKGRVKVRACFDGIPYKGSLVNMGVKNQDGSVCYVIGVLKAIRKMLNKKDGDMIHVRIEEEKETRTPQFTFMAQAPHENALCLAFSESTAQNVLRFHRSLPVYQETVLKSLQDMAEKYAVGGIFVKDESTRFGLKAFKGLGGSYSMFRVLCEKLGLDPQTAAYSDFLKPEIRRACRQYEFVTATDGNHGKGVSWAAKLFGTKAHVYMPKGTVEVRRQAIEAAGSATAEITEWNYDGAVAYAASMAEKNGWILIQDTAWDGYEVIPKWIMEGYLTLAAEAAAQLEGRIPTHVFLQAGVGAMAGAVEAYLMNRFAKTPPAVCIVEPVGTPCVYYSVQIGDGLPHTVTEEGETIMAGLNCGTPCRSIWPVLRDCSSFFCSCQDSVSEKGMRAYGHPEGSDPVVVSGESGAVTYGLLLSILEDKALRKSFGIDEKSVILLVNTEGDTDPENYRRIVG